MKRPKGEDTRSRRICLVKVLSHPAHQKSEQNSLSTWDVPGDGILETPGEWCDLIGR